jgi:hypothetical protein
MRWLSAPRTLQQLQTILQSQCTCSFLEQNAAPHQQSRLLLRESSSARLPIESMLASIGQYFMIILPVPKRSELVVEKKSAADTVKQSMRLDLITTRTRWPTNLQQILPHGAESTTRGLLRWFHLDLGEVIQMSFVKFLEGFFYFTSPQTLPYFVTSDVFLARGTIPVMIYALQYLSPNPQADMLPSEAALSVQGRHFNALMMLLTCASFMFSVIVSKCNHTQRMVLLEHTTEDVIDLCDRSALALRVAMHRFDPAHRGVASNVLRYFRELYVIVSQNHHLFLDKTHLRVVRGDISPLWGSTLESISHRARSQTCSSPECSKTFLDTWPFRYCGGCKTDCYCSRRCQKIAWTHPVAPHRLVCNLVRLVYVQNRLNTTTMTLRRVEAPPTTFEEDAGHRIVQHYQAQTRYEMATYCKCIVAHVRPVSDVTGHYSRVQVGEEVGGGDVGHGDSTKSASLREEIVPLDLSLTPMRDI